MDQSGSIMVFLYMGKALSLFPLSYTGPLVPGVPRCTVSENVEFAFLFIMSTNKETIVVVIQESTINCAE